MSTEKPYRVTYVSTRCDGERGPVSEKFATVDEAQRYVRIHFAGSLVYWRAYIYDGDTKIMRGTRSDTRKGIATGARWIWDEAGP